MSKLAQRNTNPHIEHFEVLKRVLRYLSGTADMKLVFKASDKQLEGFVDADWGGNLMDRKAYTGFVFFFGGNIVSWESRKYQLHLAVQKLSIWQHPMQQKKQYI